MYLQSVILESAKKDEGLGGYRVVHKKNTTYRGTKNGHETVELWKVEGNLAALYIERGFGLGYKKAFVNN